MTIKTIETSGLASAIQAVRLPHNTQPQSRIVVATTNTDFEEGASGTRYSQEVDIDFAQKDYDLLRKLVLQGDDHAKAVRGILAYADITAPIYWWCELETYRCGHERLSSASTMHTECKNYKGAELVKAKSEMPMGHNLRKIDFFSYQALRHIYFQRRNHRLPEWQEFIEWIHSLPYSELITCER